MDPTTKPTKIVHGYVCPAHGLIATIEHTMDEHPPVPREVHCNVATWAGEAWQVCPAVPLYTSGLSFDAPDAGGQGVDGVETVASLPAGVPAGGANPPAPAGTAPAPANTIDPNATPEPAPAVAAEPATGAVV